MSKSLSITQDPSGGPQFRLAAECVRLTIQERYHPGSGEFVLTGAGEDSQVIEGGPVVTLECHLEPGQRILLTGR